MTSLASTGPPLPTAQRHKHTTCVHARAHTHTMFGQDSMQWMCKGFGTKPGTHKCLISSSYYYMETTYQYNLWFILSAPYKSTNLLVWWLLICLHCTRVDIMLSNQDKGSFQVLLASVQPTSSLVSLYHTVCVRYMTGYHSVIIWSVWALSPQGQFSLFEGGAQGSFSIGCPTEDQPRWGLYGTKLAKEWMHCASRGQREGAGAEKHTMHL